MSGWKLKPAAEQKFNEFGEAVLRMHGAVRDGESGTFAVEMSRAEELLRQLIELQEAATPAPNRTRRADERIWDETLRRRRHEALETRRGN